MPAQSVDKIMSVKSIVQHLIEYHKGSRYIPGKDGFGQFEIVIVIKHIEIIDHILISYLTCREACYLVEY